MDGGKQIGLALLALGMLASTGTAGSATKIGHLQGEMVGEVTASSAILQSRLTATERGPDGEVPGALGVARFELADNPDFQKPSHTPWIDADPEQDYIIKTVLRDLKPATRYYYRLEFGATRNYTDRGPTRTFRTLPASTTAAPVRFVVVTGMNYDKFHNDENASDKHLGYPALVSILNEKPDFFIGTGDNVYYDSPRNTAARTVDELRHKWQQQFVQPRYVELFASVPTYWEKDDHDFRFDDADLTGDEAPSAGLGIRIFKEQLPVTDPGDLNAVTYRTHRVGKLVQIWLVENRDYRSPNSAADGPEKTIWGKPQREWLQRTLLESDAPFKFLISPTPMVGPDDLRKKDNHTDIGGFRHEGESFFTWARENGFLEKGLYILCGDRHWQYHSIHPSGFEEFSCGALVDANSRLGVKPGDKKGTDPDALIRQPYTSTVPSGGYLNVEVTADPQSQTATARFKFLDEHGKLLYQTSKQQPLR